MSTKHKICVIGLGYVGLPLAVALARHFSVTGYDTDAKRVAELCAGVDGTEEVGSAALVKFTVTDDVKRLVGHDVFIVAVPTPVDTENQPDLSAVLAAADTVGRSLQKGTIVVLESTVYPGVTEEVFGPALERASGLTCGQDFFLGYSPERINPGDREHTVDRITKVIASQSREVTATLEDIYGAIAGRICIARDIKTAEAAKAIENAQRDLNIAFVNEVASIVGRMGLSIHDVLDVAETKWNFLPFRPGLVGGHCIGVDPFYLAYTARAVGYEPEIVLAGRRINDAMAGEIAQRIVEEVGSVAKQILVLGLTFKENVPDLRNSKAAELVLRLESHGLEVTVHDPLASATEAKLLYGIDLVPEMNGPYDALVGAVEHASYRKLSAADFAALVRPGGLVADIKGMWRSIDLPPGLHRWQL